MKKLLKIYLRKPELAGIVLLAVLIGLFQVRSQMIFLSAENIRGVLGVLPEVGLVAIGVTLLMICGDVLVNAAAMTDRGTILDTDPALFDTIFATNVRAPFFLMQETMRVMRRERTEGSIVNICSMSAMAGQPFIAAYCASKGALATLTQNTGYALLRNRIRVNELNLGWMASDGEDRIQRDYHGAADDWLAQAGAAQPFGRLIEPEEAARAVAFLASGESGLMTGSMVNFDQSVWGAFDDAPHPAAAL